MRPVLPWESWSQFVAENPWASELMDVMRFVHTLIDQWGNLVLLVGLAFLWRRLRKEGIHLEERRRCDSTPRQQPRLARTRLERPRKQRIAFLKRSPRGSQQAVRW
jgi:hypothetical protein